MTSPACCPSAQRHRTRCTAENNPLLIDTVTELPPACACSELRRRRARRGVARTRPRGGEARPQSSHTGRHPGAGARRGCRGSPSQARSSGWRRAALPRPHGRPHLTPAHPTNDAVRGRHAWSRWINARVPWDVAARRLGSRLAFGTAGIRGPMAAGASAMNDLTVIQTCQASRPLSPGAKRSHGRALRGHRGRGSIAASHRAWSCTWKRSSAQRR